MYEVYQRLLDKQGLKNADVARATGISNMTLSDWKRGKSVPKSDKMRKIAEYLNVSVDYLMTGNEAQFIVEAAKNDALLTELPSSIKEYASKLAEMPKEQQEHIMSLIEMLSDKKDEK